MNFRETGCVAGASMELVWHCPATGFVISRVEPSEDVYFLSYILYLSKYQN